MIKVLDCTLRDGGYVNNWDFGYTNIKKIIKHLTTSEIDIIECGFLTNKKGYTNDQSQFNTIGEMSSVIPMDRKKSKYVCMINFGEYDVDEIPDCDGTSVDGIRVVFHQKELLDVIEYCRTLSKKGYMLFVQPMVTINYSDLELIELVKMVNEFNTYAFYIVDSFGVMKENDLKRMFYLVDNNLSPNINIGYHSHNNLQLAYSNAQSLVSIHTNRTRIIDSSVFGMGRGAGNLNTELFVEFLNENYNTNYKVHPLLTIIDETLNKIYAKNYWGYSLPHYLSATSNCHPNYASYLSEKNTLTIKSISEILEELPAEKKEGFDKKYIEDLYLNHQQHYIDDSKTVEQISSEFEQKNLLLIAPGKSIEEFQQKIIEQLNAPNTVSISINFIPQIFRCNYAFISNLKRYEQILQSNILKENANIKLIATSNIQTSKDHALVANYSELLSDKTAVSDNSALMLLKFLIKAGVKKVSFAGFDGYSYDQSKNYADKEMTLSTSYAGIDALNNGIASVLNELSDEIEIEFITPTKYQQMLKF